MRKWLPLLTVCLGTAMIYLDVTIVNVALPPMAAELRTTFGDLQWVVDGYALALAALVLAAGAIADAAGHRRVFVVGVLLFVVASLAGGTAATAQVLVGARILQGIGSAGMLATTFALLSSHYQGIDRGVAYGLWGSVAGGASAAGPVVGGFLTDAASWRWVFFVNVPIAVAVLVLAFRALRPSPRHRVGRRLDVPGALTFTAATASLTGGLIRANENGWDDRTARLLLVAAPVLLATFLLVERLVPAPLVDPALLRQRTFVGVMVAALLTMFAAFGTYAYTSIWLQSVLGLSPVRAGLTAVPLSAMAFAVALALGRAVGRVHHRHVIAGGLLLVGVGALVTAVLLGGHPSWAALLPGSVVAGVGVGLANPVLGAAAAAAVPLERSGMAAGVLNTMRQLGFVLGVALLGSVFAARAATALAGLGAPEAGPLARALSAGQVRQVLAQAPTPARADLDLSLHAAAAGGLQSIFLVCGLVGLVSALVVHRLLRPATETTTEPAPDAPWAPRTRSRSA